MRRRVPRAVLPWLLWSIPAAFITAITLHEYHVPFWRVALAESLPWYYWALMTRPILRLAYASAPDGLGRISVVLRHIATAIPIGAVCGLISALGLIAFEVTPAHRPPGDLVVSSAIFWSIFGLIFYTLITAIGMAIAAQARVREREVAASKLEARLVEAQLHGLRMQLQPHFLFNTLNTAAMYVRDGDATTSIRVLAQLSDLLRRVLDTGADQEVPLSLEIEHVERYLEIETLRFSDRLRVRVDVPADLRTALVPNLALQPLVENAVRHGIAQQSEQGTIEVSARRDGEDVVVRVVNTGPALPQEFRMDAAPGIGLRNTQLRLRHLYGDRAELRICNENSGVLCEMRIPYHTEPIPVGHG